MSLWEVLKSLWSLWKVFKCRWNVFGKVLKSLQGKEGVSKLHIEFTVFLWSFFFKVFGKILKTLWKAFGKSLIKNPKEGEGTQTPSGIKYISLKRIQLWDRELERFFARKWQNLHNSPLSLSNSRLHENWVSQYYTIIVHFSISFGVKMGQ